jgi:hypothetical protein
MTMTAIVTVTAEAAVVETAGVVVAAVTEGRRADPEEAAVAAEGTGDRAGARQGIGQVPRGDEPGGEGDRGSRRQSRQSQQ